MIRRFAIMITLCVLSIAFVWGAGNSAAPAAAPSAPAGSSGPVSPTLANLGFPLKTPITITYWAPMNGQEAAVMKSYAEKTLWIDMQKLTNINIQFEHPSVAAADAFSLLLATGDLPDIIEYNQGWQNVPGGLDGLIDDKMILNLTPYFNSTDMPNMRKLLDDNPTNIDALMKTGQGRYWGFTNIYIGESCWAGPMLRQDYLDKVNMKVPQTIDDWYNVLKAFKAMGVKIPLGFEAGSTYQTYGIFIGAYDVIQDFFVGTDKKIHYGPIEDGYKQWLTLWNKWYSEGLIDPEFATTNSTTYRANAISGTYGAFTGSSSGTFEAFGSEIMKNTPGASLVGAPYPKLNAGQTLRFRQQSEDVRPGQWTAISAKTKYPMQILKMFDYMYSPEGSFLCTYGNEGEAYTLNAQGKPVATPLLTNNPLAAFGDIVNKYSGRNSPYLREAYEWRFLDFYNTQAAVRDIWDKSANFDGLRPSYSLSPDDAPKVNRIMAEINTYMNEMFLKFVMGQEPLTNFDSYVQKIKSMGIDDALAAHNAAYAKFTSGK